MPCQELPSEESTSTDVATGKHEVYPAALLFSEGSAFNRCIDNALQHRDTSIAVIQPLSAQAPTTVDSEHPWGPTQVNTSPFGLRFDEIKDPATTPPVLMMTILTPGSWRDIEIVPDETEKWVTVSNVQNEVVRWMRDVTLLALSEGEELSLSLSQMTSILMPDGSRVEVEVWQWRGLERHGLESHLWELRL